MKTMIQLLFVVNFYGLSFASRWPISNSSNANADVMTSAFGPRQNGSNYQLHWGLDISTNGTNMAVFAIKGGRVNDIGTYFDGTIHIDIENSDGTLIKYLHLYSEPGFNIGDIVAEGEQIAISGRSGPLGTPYHLHVGYYPYSGFTDPLLDTDNPLRVLAHNETSAYSVGDISWITNGGLDGSGQIAFDLYVHPQRLDVNKIVISISNTHDIYGFLKNESDLLNSQPYGTNVLGRIDFEGRSNVDYNPRNISGQNVQEFNGVKIEPASYDNSDQQSNHRYTIKFNVKNSELGNLAGNIGSVSVTVYNPNGTYSMISSTYYVPVYWTETWPSSIITLSDFSPPLTVRNGGKIVVQNGGIVTGSSKPANNYPKLYGYMIVESGGSLELLAGPDVDRRTWFSVKAGGILTIYSGGILSMYSHTVLRNCGTFSFNGTPDFHGGTNAELFLNCQGGTANINVNTSLNSDGTCILIKDGGVLKVASGKTLTFSNGAFLAGRTGGIVIVDTGATFTLDATAANSFADSAVVFQFGPSAQLNCNKKLTAVGTSTNPVTFTSTGATTPGSWGSIIFSGSGASGSTLTYCKVQYGTQIQALSTSNITIQNSTITEVQQGVRFNASTGSVLNNTLTSSTIYHGIIIESGSTVTCNQNVVTKLAPNTLRGVGILYVGSGGNLWQNDVYGWEWGLGAIWGASPNFFDPSLYGGRGNRIRNCLFGVEVYQQSYPVIGYPAGPYQDHSIHSNTYNVGLNNYYSTVSTLYASRVYWGPQPPPAQCLIGAGSTIQHYDMWYSYDPWAGYQPSAFPADVATASSVSEESTQAGASTDDPLWEGRFLLLQNRKREAKDFFLSYISQHPDNQAAYVQLFNCYSDETANDLIHFFNSLPPKAAKEHRLLLSYLYRRQGNAEMARKANEAIIAENPNTPLATMAKLNNVYIALYHENNVDRASALLNEASTRPELSTEVELSLARDAVETHGQMSGREKSSFPQLQARIEEKMPKEIGVGQNYPNPFNPLTVINYQLLTDAHVRIKIFDPLGRQVATLVDEIKTAGYHKVEFNASRLPSGVYFYLMTAGEYRAVKKMAFIK